VAVDFNFQARGARSLDQQRDLESNETPGNIREIELDRVGVGYSTRTSIGRPGLKRGPVRRRAALAYNIYQLPYGKTLAEKRGSFAALVEFSG
jgi:hypothetical protein